MCKGKRGPDLLLQHAQVIGNVVDPFDTEKDQVAKSQGKPPACSRCKDSKVKCEGGIPCQRCVRLGKWDSCVPGKNKKRGRKRKGRQRDDDDDDVIPDKRQELDTDDEVKVKDEDTESNAEHSQLDSEIGETNTWQDMDTEMMQLASVLYSVYRDWMKLAQSNLVLSPFEELNHFSQLSRFKYFCHEVFCCRHMYTADSPHDIPHSPNFQFTGSSSFSTSSYSPSLSSRRFNPSTSVGSIVFESLAREVYSHFNNMATAVDDKTLNGTGPSESKDFLTLRIPNELLTQPVANLALQPTMFPTNVPAQHTLSLCTTLGYSSEELANILNNRSRFYHLIHHMSYASFFTAFWELVSAGSDESRIINMKLRRKDGSLYHCNCTMSLKWNQLNDLPTNVNLLFTDIGASSTTYEIAPLLQPSDTDLLALPEPEADVNRDFFVTMEDSWMNFIPSRTSNILDDDAMMFEI